MVIRLLSPLTAQLVGVTAAFAALAFAPPVSGRMLLVPLSGNAATRLVPVAVEHGARLIGAGPLPHSYIVYADRADILSSLAHAGIVTLAAPPSGCGDTDRPA